MGTQGVTHADVILLDVKDSTGLAAYQGQLKNKMILIRRTDSLALGFQA